MFERDFADFDITSTIPHSGGFESIEFILGAHPRFQDVLKRYNPIHTAGIWGGLLTAPELQSNCLRLEALAHLTVAFAVGKEKPSVNAIAAWFSEMNDGPCGHAEDPAEDVFVSYVTTPQGGYRVLEGMWESAGFYLQRVVNLVNGMPKTGDWLSLRQSVNAFLQLSDVICDRAEIHRYSSGNEFPEEHLANDTLSQLQSLRQRVTFSESELSNLGISIEALHPFIFDPSLRNVLPVTSIGHSPLVERPILARDGIFVVAIPTAISAAIREFVIGSLLNAGLQHQLAEALASEYQEHFRRYPILDNVRGSRIHFNFNGSTPLATYGSRVDEGRWFQVVFVLDYLNGYESTGLGGYDPDVKAVSAEINQTITEFRNQMQSEHLVRQGITLIVSCGIGRGSGYSPQIGFDNWQVIHISSADVSTLGFLDDVTPLSLFRLLDAEEVIAQSGVSFLNINGLLNQFAWVRSLSGHLVPHQKFPDDLSLEKIQVVLAPCTVHGLRVDIKQRIDHCCLECVDGRWMVMNKPNSSHFEEDNLEPIYHGDDFSPEFGVPLAFVSPTRTWWCKVLLPCEWEDWKMFTKWIARFAGVLDRNLDFLPTGPLELRVRFWPKSSEIKTPQHVTQEQIRAGIRTTTDLERRVVSLTVDESFFHGLANPINVAETTLIEAIVEGFLAFGDCDKDILTPRLLREIVPDQHARDRHMFYAQDVRDYVRDSLPDKPIAIDSMDDATLRLGLGWRVRERAQGATIHGKRECTSFLNSLVKLMERQLCDDLRLYNKAVFLNRVLANHESAVLVHQRWRKTAAANLSIHNDKPGALQAMADQEFRNNGVQLASRVLVEAGLCECRLSEGVAPGDLDIARLIAKVLLIVRLGDWSNGIYLEVMEPTVKLSPLGEVQLDESFFVEVMRPFGDETHKRMINGAIADYSDHFRDPTIKSDPSTSHSLDFESDFQSAWAEELGLTIEDCTNLVIGINRIGVQREQAIFEMRRTELVKLLEDSVADPSKALLGFTLSPRGSWHLPDQSDEDFGYTDKDRQPWRFRRRLSAIRRPILQLDETDDPVLLIAPGLIDDGIAYTLRNYYEGAFDAKKIPSRLMRSWSGFVADRQGNAFSRKVAGRLAELEWTVKCDVSVRTILGEKTQIDYGDVDVLAWNESTGQVLLIECKDLHFHKTAGDLAEQLKGFRGLEVNGKRDYLKRHIDRCDVLNERSKKLTDFIGLRVGAQIEGRVVFRNHVPMLHVWKNLGTDIKFLTFRDLGEISLGGLG